MNDRFVRIGDHGCINLDHVVEANYFPPVSEEEAKRLIESGDDPEAEAHPGKLRIMISTGDMVLYKGRDARVVGQALGVIYPRVEVAPLPPPPDPMFDEKGKQHHSPG